ncbi:hypothetical protein [Microbacterium elymi]|uniref:Lipoprotein n=1 Tax=Microbacterium elymi TaxID=2909587 RepID=A0ABY5NL17_9MICO|nr:hypothetical protein [Microbacterium elymi]UUT35843.1 hypothetical protein L2X98_21965 [Microbacterium elymi]
MSSRLIRATVTAVVAGVCAAGLLTGCAPEPHETPTPTPRFTSEAQAFQAAEETYRAYVDATNKVDLSDPATFEDVFHLTTGQQNADDKKALTAYHAAGVTESGESQIELIRATSAASDLSKVELAICLDVSDVKVVDSAGKSLVDPNRVDVQRLAVTLNDTATSGRSLLISEIKGRDGGPRC